MVDANYARAGSGDVVSSECLEYEPTLAQTLRKVRPPPQSVQTSYVVSPFSALPLPPSTLSRSAWHDSVSQPFRASSASRAVSFPALAEVCLHPQALLTTGLTLPTIMALNAMFAHLRSPHEHAIEGEFASKSDADIYDCCIIEKV